jgi:hypothetical protein
VSNVFVYKRERWGLTVWGWLAVLFSAAAAGFFGIRQVNGILSITNPIEGELLGDGRIGTGIKL